MPNIDGSLTYNLVREDRVIYKRPDLYPDYVFNQNTSLVGNYYRHGSTAPDWRRRIQQGVSATTQLVAAKTIYEFTAGEVSATYAESHPTLAKEWRVTGVLTPEAYHVLPPAYAPEVAFDAAKRRFIGQCLDLRRQVMSGVVLGELQKTLHLLRNPALSLIQEIRTYLTRAKTLERRGSTASRTKALANLYLEANFGWQPLLYDIAGAIRALDEIRAKRPFEIRKVRGTGKQNSAISDSRTASYTCGLLLVDYIATTKVNVSYKIVGGYRVDSANTGPLQSLGLTPADFVPTLWELMPWSFVADYFTNIGAIIDAYSYVTGNIAWSSVNLKQISVTKNANMAYNDSISNEAESHTFTPCKVALKDKYLSRDSMTSFVPTLGLRLPGLGTKPFYNMVALALGRVPHI